MSEHTPGPWEAVGYNAEQWVVYTNARIQTITDILSESDARLIAAAPDLVAALEAMIDGTSCVQYGPACEAHGGYWPCPQLAARAAIAKARGEVTA